MEKILQKLREFDALRDSSGADYTDRVKMETVPAIAPKYASNDVFEGLPTPVTEALLSMGVTRLYDHQARAIEEILKGNDVVIVSPTASGKTLCFNIPIVVEAAKNRNSHALMVYPMKAIANDQRHQLDNLCRNIHATKIESYLYDGDTPDDIRATLRKSPPHVLLTNPEMLHQSFLAHWEQWTGFLANLRFLVIDEIHEYRGYFGTNFALLVRRFLRKLDELGAKCQLILASATCANPDEHAFRLTGRKPVLVRAEDIMRPPRTYVFINPKLPRHQYYRIYLLRIALASLACLSEGMSVVVFGPTRKFAEEAARAATTEAKKRRLDPSKIVPYRAGYKPEERRRIEEGLRNGTYQVVFSTSALEIGIDIGRLDACILAGFPDSVLSAWQRIGRAGRSWAKNSLVLFYALDNPTDQFYAENLDAFLNKPLDQITVGLENEQLVNKHIPCLLYERKLPIEGKDKVILGDYFYEKACKAQDGFTPVRGHSPHQQTPIRNLYSKSYRLIYKGGEIGTISGEQVQREAYIGAIYNHLGRPYRVESHGTEEISLIDADPNMRTEPITWSVVTESSVRAAHRYGKEVSWSYGDLTIYDNFGGYRVIDEKTGAVIADNRLDSPTATRRMVQGCWVTVETPEWEGLRNISSRLAVVRFLLHSGTPLTIPCDRFDIASLNKRELPPAAYVYETVPGGIGIVEKLFNIWPEVLKQGILIAENCSQHCKMGCPFCMYLDRFARSEDRSSKTEGIELASSLLQAYRDGAIEVFDPSTGTWRPE